jgi:hypothetical protein
MGPIGRLAGGMKRGMPRVMYSAAFDSSVLKNNVSSSMRPKNHSPWYRPTPPNMRRELTAPSPASCSSTYSR